MAVCLSFPFSNRGPSCMNRGLVIFFIVWVFPSTCSAQNWELQLLDKINPQHPTSSFWLQTSYSAYWAPAITCAGSLGYGFLKKDKQMLQNGAQLLLNIGATLVISQALKHSIQRTRPGDEYPELIYPDHPKSDNMSFPSGHTSMAFSTATTLALVYRKWYVVVPAYAWAGCVGYSRMYLGQHYPSDVLGGMVVGVGSGYLSHWLSKKLFYPKQIQSKTLE